MSSNLLLIALGILLLIIAAIIVIVSLPNFKRLAQNLGLLEEPKNRSQHRIPMVRLGGISIVFAFIITFSLSLILYNYTLIDDQNNHINQLYLILQGGLCMFLIGVLDDIFQLNPFIRLLLQINVGAYIFSNGLQIRTIDLSGLPLIDYSFELITILSFIITILWVVGFTNAINWIDGLDGLAAGVSLISMSGIIVISFLNKNILLGLMGICLVGACIGFLKYNFFPAKIFMGDGGSYFLGFMISTITIVNLSVENLIYNSLGLVLIIFYPIFDMTLVIIKRIVKGSSPFKPDLSHFHHLLINSGNNHRKSVITIYIINVILLLLGTFISLC